MAKVDQNDRLLAGTLPDDPHEGAPMAADVPEIVTVRDGLSAAMSRAFAPRRSQQMTSTDSRIDAATGGLRAGKVWLIGAFTSWGKSNLAIAIADENMAQGKNVLIVSSEDDEATYFDRLLCRRSRVNASSLRDNCLTPAERDAITETVRRGERKPFFINGIGRTIESLAPQVKRAIVELDIHLCLFDYVQTFQTSKKSQDRRAEVEHTARVLTDVIKTVKPGGIAGVILAQLTPRTGDSAPDMFSVRESNGLAMAAEVVLIGYQSKKEIPELGIMPGDRLLRIEKAKGGVPGATLKMDWDPRSACFNRREERAPKRDESDPFAGSFEDR